MVRLLHDGPLLAETVPSFFSMTPTGIINVNRNFRDIAPFSFVNVNTPTILKREKSEYTDICKI